MNRVMYIILVYLLLSCTQQDTTLFIGSYTDNKPAAGITVHSFDESTGSTKLLFRVDSLINPSFLKLSESKRILFVITESKLKTPGVLSSYKIKNDGLEEISSVTTGGRNPVHIAVSHDGKAVAVSNYTDAGLAYYKVDKEGLIDPEFQLFNFQDSSIIAGRQDEAHIHSANFSADGRFLYAHDLGGDKIRAFEIKDTIVLREDLNIEIEPGSGPRHFTFDRLGKYGYLVNELSGRIDIFAYNGNSGELSLIGTQKTYEEELDIYRSADIHVSADNQFLFVSNRGPAENTIVVFKILKDGKLEFVDRKDSGGSFPRNFAISLDGKWILSANRESNNVCVFEFDSETGLISEMQSEIKIKQPSSIQILQH